MKVGVEKTYRAPFSLPRVTVLDQKKNIVIGRSASLNDRLLYLARTKHSLVSCQNLPDLYRTIFKVAFKNFFGGMSLVYAGFLVDDEFTALAIPEKVPPIAGNEKPSQDRPELIQKAIDAKEIILLETEDEDFLAVPLLRQDNKDLLGCLLLSNRLSMGREEFNDIDIEVARSFSEVASEAMLKLMPVRQ